MFSDLLIDKERIVFSKKDVTYEDRQEIQKVLKSYFSDSSVDYKSGNVLITFTPTKMNRNSEDNNNHNLQMPTQETLLKFHKKLCLNNEELSNEFTITKLHLTKNILVSRPVQEYIELLGNMNYSRVTPELITSDKNGNCSLYLRYLSDYETHSDFTIKFYDKALEYYKRHKTYICKLKEPLTDYEIEQVESVYNKENNTLNLEHLNILRIEIEFERSKKLQAIIKALDNSYSALSMDLFIKALEEGCLYKVLDNVFNQTLRKVVFNATKTLEDATAELSKIRQLACFLLCKSDEFYHYKAVADELGLENQFSTLKQIVKKIVPNSELYSELYDKLFHSVNNDESLSVEQLIECCNSYRLQNLLEFLLIYEVPIWDDS